MIKTNQKTATTWRVIPFLLIIAFAVFMTACKSKEAVTAEIFIQKVEASGCQTLDVTEQYSEFSHISKVISARYESVRMDFLEIIDTDSATGVFNTNKAAIEGYKGNGSTESSVSAGNYQKYTLKTSEKYYIVERVGTTVIYSYCDKSESESLDNIIKVLGY